MARILVVEDRDSLRRMLERALAGEGHSVTTAADTPEAAACLSRGERFDLVLTDLKLSSGSGLDVVAEAKQRHPEAPVVVLTAFGSVAVAVEAMKRGATDFLEKPVDLEALFALVRALVERDRVEERFEVAGAPPIVGCHPRLRAALRLLGRVAPAETTVLLTGESGTGKELGHERGAFTGADRRRAGRFELARGGTIFLDEIGELPLAVQAKVLRVLDDRGFERVGGGETLRADARVVTATNRDLAAMVVAGRFRSDLLYRLEIFPIALPALAERREDIPLLAGHLLARIAERHRKPPPALAETALERLAAEAWPGNVRQLANVLERAVILHAGETLGEPEIAALLAAPKEEESESDRLRAALLDSGGDKKVAAKRLGVTYRELLRRVKALDLGGFPKYRD